MYFEISSTMGDMSDAGETWFSDGRNWHLDVPPPSGSGMTFNVGPCHADCEQDICFDACQQSLREDVKRLQTFDGKKRFALVAHSRYFNKHLLQNLESDYREQGQFEAAQEIVVKMREAMETNAKALCVTYSGILSVFRALPELARSLDRDDTKQRECVISFMAKNLSDVAWLVDRQLASFARLRRELEEQAALNRRRVDVGDVATSSLLVAGSVGPVCDVGVTAFALSEGAANASSSPVTAWLTTSVARHVVGAGTVVVSVFHVASLAIALGVAGVLCCGGGIAAAVKLQKRGPVSEFSKATGRSVEAIRMNEDMWHGLKYSVEELERHLEGWQESSPSSHQFDKSTWATALASTAMLISSADTFLVWLDMAGYFPPTFPLRSRLQMTGVGGESRYDLIASILREL